MMRPVRFALLALLALAAAPAAALHAQAPAGEAATEAAARAASGSPVSQPAAAGAPVSAPAADAPSSASSLPRYTPPRTLRAYAHVFVAFAVAWVLLFGYVVFLARRFRRVEEQVEALARS